MLGMARGPTLIWDEELFLRQGIEDALVHADSCPIGRDEEMAARAKWAVNELNQQVAESLRSKGYGQIKSEGTESGQKLFILTEKGRDLVVRYMREHRKLGS